ncbi:MAG: M28 family peptidase [Lentisphaeria bacterium]|nr:M28 family peptidase [Lentisphaeria bacterium]
MDETCTNLEKNLRVLTDRIGIRLAGSKQEYQAAEYLAETFRQYSSRVTIEKYPVMERCVTSEQLQVRINGEWQDFPCSLFSSAPSTDGRRIEADLVFFDTATGYQRSDLSFLTGKAVVHLGCHIESEDNYRRLMEAKPAFILFVDTRFTGTVQLADGLFPAYVKKYGAVPSLNTAYMDAWKWLQQKASRAGITVSGGTRESQTTVVICEIPGCGPGNDVLYAGGHHDTQAGTVGADDNAIGSVCMIELARLLAAKPHRRTFRLISFGAEEQLSLGSASYIRRHRDEITRNGVFMCNFDSAGSALGWGEFTVNANAALRRKIAAVCRKHDIYYVELTEPCPYTDQFPFAACGVPGIWLYRKNCIGGNYYHHRFDNTPDIIGFDEAAKLVHASAELLADLADRDNIDSFRGIPAKLQSQIDAQFQAVYGGF